VDTTELNGTGLKAGSELPSSGNANFKLPPSTDSTIPAADLTVTKVGSGKDQLFFALSQDLTKGDLKFKLYVDMVQVGGTLTSKADHDQGQSDLFQINGDFGEGKHALTVYVLEDQAGNLDTLGGSIYVDRLSYNDVGMKVAEIGGGSGDYNYLFG
jgi:hypothetical protein